jgi:hypothetical protein
MASHQESSGKKKKLRTAHSTVIGNAGIVVDSLPGIGGDDSEMIMQYEKRIAEMLMTIQK